MQDEIKEIVEEREISWMKYVKKNNIYTTNNTNLHSNIPDSTKQMIRVANNLRIPYAKAFSLNEVCCALEKLYPQVVEQLEKANEMNKDLPCFEQISGKFNITASCSNQYITKIGFRLTSAVTSLKTLKHHAAQAESEKYTGVWREDYLKEQLDGEYQSFDIGSSIFRLTYHLNHNDYLNDCEDLYVRLHGKPFANDKQRTAYKLFKMRQYFETPKNLVHHIMPVFDASQKEQIAKEVRDDKRREIDILGASIGSEIFVHESCIYNELVYRIRALGYRIIQIYDGFYFNAPIINLLKSELRTIIREYKLKLLHGEYGSYYLAPTRTILMDALPLSEAA